MRKRLLRRRGIVSWWRRGSYATSLDFGSGKTEWSLKTRYQLSVVGGASGRGTTGREGTSNRVVIDLRESGRPGAKEVEA